jgi:hypothetical protein
MDAHAHSSKIKAQTSIATQGHPCVAMTYRKRSPKESERIKFVSIETDKEESCFFIQSVTAACGSDWALEHAL